MTSHCLAGTLALLSLWLMGTGSATGSESEGTATFVTALYDIGRGNWTTYTRHFCQYLDRLRHLLALDINLVIYGDVSLKPFVKQHRRTKKSKTRFIVKPFQDLAVYKHKLRLECVMDSKKFKENNEMLMRPQAFSTDYVILIYSKAFLIGETARRNPFKTTHFFWIDAGYVAHEQLDETLAFKSSIPPETKWEPKPLLSTYDRVTYIQLNDPAAYEHLTDLHKLPVEAAFAGGFFGGSGKIVQYFERLFNKCMLSDLSEGAFGDEQRLFLHAYWEQPGIFNLVPGDWFDAYKLFH